MIEFIYNIILIIISHKNYHNYKFCLNIFLLIEKIPAINKIFMIESFKINSFKYFNIP